MRIRFDTRGFDRTIDKTKQELDQLSEDAYKYFVSATPIKTGNARRSTDLSNNKIIADYPYAQRLDEGWSKQSPDGMTGPTEDHIVNVLIPKAIRRINRGQ
jgi:hypothetical protein